MNSNKTKYKEVILFLFVSNRLYFNRIFTSELEIILLLLFLFSFSFLFCTCKIIWFIRNRKLHCNCFSSSSSYSFDEVQITNETFKIKKIYFYLLFCFALMRLFTFWWLWTMCKECAWLEAIASILSASIEYSISCSIENN